jgi:hypothetical protein
MGKVFFLYATDAADPGCESLMNHRPPFYVLPDAEDDSVFILDIHLSLKTLHRVPFSRKVRQSGKPEQAAFPLWILYNV